MLPWLTGIIKQEINISKYITIYTSLMVNMGKRLTVLILAIVIVIIIAVGTILLSGSPATPATIDIQFNPSILINVNQGESSSLEIILRNSPGLKAAAEGVEGELVLPDGFIEESLQTQTRQLIFGRIHPGEAGQYTLTIAALNTVEAGEHYAKLTVWGTNIPRQEVNLKIIVNP
jgi:hypothetical protein